MAHKILQLHPLSGRNEIKIHDLELEDIVPNGDRYVVEIIDVDETIQLGTLMVVTQDLDQMTGSPMANPNVERRGVLVGVVVSAGNGHLLGLPDLAPVEKALGAKYDEDGEPDGALYVPGDRPWPSVEMFYEPGDVVLIDINAKGRALKIIGREGRIINQIDVLASIPKLKYERNDGAWKPKEA